MMKVLNFIRYILNCSKRAIIYYFLGAAFLAAGFLAAGFLAAGFLAAGFLAAGFLAAGFLEAGFLAAFFGFLAAGFFAFLTFLGFLAFGFFTFLTFLGFSTLTTLKLPAPLPDALAILRAPLATPRLRAMRTWTTALTASTLKLAQMYLRMACREEPVRSLRVVMAAAIITEYLGWAAGALGLVAFFTIGAGADMLVSCEIFVA